MRYGLLLYLLASPLQAQPNLPGMAMGMIDQANLAQQAVSSRDKDAAIDHIKQGLSLADEIRSNSPESVRPILIPVNKELETTTTYTPVKHKDGEMGADRLKKNSSIRGVSGDLTVTSLDVLAAADHLRAAQTSLSAGDWAAAAAALGAVHTSVVVTQSQGTMPLDMARRNLDLARARVLEGKYKDAAVPLRSAAQALGDFEKHCTAQQAASVESARQAIAGYSDYLSHDHDGALGKIDAWKDMLNQWQ
jgi:hypothetical protein